MDRLWLLDSSEVSATFLRFRCLMPCFFSVFSEAFLLDFTFPILLLQITIRRRSTAKCHFPRISMGYFCLLSSVDVIWKLHCLQKLLPHCAFVQAITFPFFSFGKDFIFNCLVIFVAGQWRSNVDKKSTCRSSTDVEKLPSQARRRKTSESRKRTGQHSSSWRLMRRTWKLKVYEQKTYLDI